MKKLKSILEAIVHFGQEVWHFPRSVAIALKLRREQVLLDAVEAERLDRIRNPSKYLGK